MFYKVVQSLLDSSTGKLIKQILQEGRILNIEDSNSVIKDYYGGILYSPNLQT